VQGRCKDLGMGSFQSVANVQFLPQSPGSKVSRPSQELQLFLLGLACPCMDNDSCAWCNSGCHRGQNTTFQCLLDEQEEAYHWGKFSSQRMCLRLQVSQPLRDLVWLLRLLVFLRVTIETEHTSDEEAHHQGQPFWMRRLRGGKIENYEA
jgi:hypothetical protein